MLVAKKKTFLDRSNLDSIFENEVFHDQTVSRLTFCGVKNMDDSFKYKGKFSCSCKQCWVCAIYVLAFFLQAFDDVKYIKKYLLGLCAISFEIKFQRLGNGCLLEKHYVLFLLVIVL